MLNPAIILNCNNIMALPIIRLLGKNNIPIIGVFGIGKNVSPFHTIIKGSKYISDKIYFEEENYLESLIQSLINYGLKQKIKPVMFLASDTDLEVISCQRQKLQEYFYFTLPPDDLIKSILNKDKFIDLAKINNLPIPKSFRICGDEPLNEILNKLNFPFIIKPSWRNNEWLRIFKEKKVFIVENSDDLKLALSVMSKHPVEYLIQEIVKGSESNIYCSFAILNENSEPIQIGFCRKLTQYPPNYGNTSIAIPIQESSLENLSREIFKKLKLIGYASIEFKFDETDGKYKIIEITPNRFNRQFAVTTLQGLNLPYTLYQYELGLPIHKYQMNNSKKLWISEANEIRIILNFEKNKIKKFLKLLFDLPKFRMFEIFDLSDPLPLFNALTKGFKRYSR